MSAAATTELTALPRSPSLPTFFDNLDSFAEAPEGVAKLRELILESAVRGKLVEQDENDEPASELLESMDSARERLVSEKKLKKSKPLLAVEDGELPYQLPSGWAATRLGEVTTISTGYAFKSPDYTPTGTFVLRVTNIKPDGTIIPDDAVFMPDEKITPRIESYYLEAGDILVVMVGGSLGKIGVVTEDLLPALLNQNMWRLRPISDDYDVEFLRLTLEYINRFQLNITSSTHGHMSMTEYKTQPIGVPPLSEQRRIVSKVDGLMSLCDELESRGSERVRLRERASRSCLDRLVSSRSRRDLSSAWQRLSDHFEVLYDTPETLAHLRQSILQLAVQGKLVPQDPNDEPAAKTRPRLAQSRRSEWEEIELAKLVAKGKKPTDDKWKRRLKPVDELEANGLHPLPQNWEWVPVEEVGAVQLGRQRAPRYASGPNMTPYLRVQNVFEDRIDITDVKEMQFDEADTATFKLRYNDILLNEGQSTKLVGRPAIYRDEVPGACFQNTLVRFRHYDDVVPEYALIVFRHYMRGRFQEICQQTTNIAHLGASRFARLEFPLPPLAEQKRIVAKVDQLLSQCDELSARLRERQSATHGLLTATVNEILETTAKRAPE